MLESEDVVWTLLVHWLVEELWEAKSRQIQSVSNPLHKAGHCRQGASGQLKALSACLKSPAASWFLPRQLAEVDITHRGNKCAPRSRCSPRMQIRATKAQMYL